LKKRLKKMRIAIGQFNALPGNSVANCPIINKLAAKAAADGCQLIVFPELCDTGYDLSIIGKTCGTWPGPAYSSVAQSAAEHKIWICCGLSERTDSAIFNSQAVFDTTGHLAARYRKVHLFSLGSICEESVFSSGNELNNHTVAGISMGLQICFDLRFPEAARTLAIKGSQIILYSAAWPLARINHWKTLLQARAIENQCFIVAANQCGTTNGLAFGSQSLIIDPNGVILAQADRQEDCVIAAEIDLSQIALVRGTMHLLKERKPDMYTV
jgi:omega-amidase